jgi:hypothetical protein
LELFDRTFSKVPSKEASGLKAFPDKAESIFRDIRGHMSVLQNQIAMISILGPEELKESFLTIARIFNKDLAPFNQALESINQQLLVASTNPKQQVVIDVGVFHTTVDQNYKLIEVERSIILQCIKPQLTAGRPITANSDLAGCLGKNRNSNAFATVATDTGTAGA